MSSNNLQFVQLPCDKIDIGSITQKVDRIFDNILDIDKAEEELSQEIARLSHDKSKRRKFDGPNHEKDKEMLDVLLEIRSGTLEKRGDSLWRSQLRGCPKLFLEYLESFESPQPVLKDVTGMISFGSLTENVVSNIGTLLEKSWLDLQDLAEDLDSDVFSIAIIKLVKLNKTPLTESVITILSSSSKFNQTLLKLIVFVITEKSLVNLGCYQLSGLSVSDVIVSLLRHQSDVTLFECYSQIDKLSCEDGFNRQVSLITKVLTDGDVKTVQVINSVLGTTEICSVNPRLFLALWFALLTVTENDDVDVLSYISEFLKKSLLKQQTDNFILSLMVLRLLDITGRSSYSENYKTLFGSSSTIITSSKSIEYIVDVFTTLVPHEVGVFLKHHTQQSLRGGTKVKDKLDQYILLAKTRLKDFVIVEIDRNVVHDVRKSVESFKKKGGIPESVTTASIFNKQYYINHYLPCLLKPNVIEDEESRLGLVNALLNKQKIPKSIMVPVEEEVEVILSSETLDSLIESIPRKGLEVKEPIFRLYCSGCSEEALGRIIHKVCFETSFIESVEFLKDFSTFHALKEPFTTTLKNMLLKTTHVRPLFALLEVLEPSDCLEILKASITNSLGVYKFIPLSLENEYLHIILLGKVTEDSDSISTIPPEVWRQVSVTALCRTLPWWPRSIPDTQTITSFMLDTLTSYQDPGKVCVAVFQTCLTHNILHFVSSPLLSLISQSTFSKLWIYEAVAATLLPLYRNKTDKPVSRIRSIFKEFFSVVNVVKPSLLYRAGGFKSIDNLLSVLDSYRIYITTHNYTFTFKIVATIIRSVQDAGLLALLLDKSPTLLISCVLHHDHLRKLPGSDHLRKSPPVRDMLAFLGQLEGASECEVPEQLRNGAQAGVVWFLKFGEQHVDYLSAGLLKGPAVEGYLSSMFYVYSKNWLAGSLTVSNLSNLGHLAILTPHYHDTYTTPLITGSPTLHSPTLEAHYNGYKTNKVFCLIYLGALAQALSEQRSNTLSVSVLSSVKRYYQQSQRLVYDNVHTMKAMQRFVMAVTGSGDKWKGGQVVQTSGEFVKCLTS